MGKGKSGKGGKQKSDAENKRKKKSKIRLADKADRHVLYQKSVQDPETEIENLTETFQVLRGRTPLSLREDFCGTAYLATEWCKSDPERSAIGVDLCTETLAWGREHNVQAAGADVVRRIQLIEGNVLNARTDLVDLLCAFNFSYNILEQRTQLLDYFKAARAALKPDGVFVIDVYGGCEAFDEAEEEREVDGEDFTYIWEQASFNPITHHSQCYIHFAFKDGSKLKRAFSYEWRVWTLPELRELLREAGFSTARIYWEEFVDSDDDDEYMEGTGIYKEVTDVDNQESWICYVYAEV